jgi:hypothetical protein
MTDGSMRVAGQSGISSLYHYQDFQPDFLADILGRHRIYCSNPNDFNDPWDCKPYFDANLLDDPAKRALVAEFFISQRKGGAELESMDRRLRTDPTTLKLFVDQFSKHYLTVIPSKWAVYCLTPDPCSTLMWSHYSRNHRGVCLEFGVDHSKFAYAVGVQYQEEYPPFSLHDPESYRSTMLLTKSDDWAYEQEYRLICPRFTDLEEHPFIMDGNYLPIGQTDLKSIILGCQATDATIASAKALAAKHAPAVAVRKATRSPNKYRLVIESI